MRHWRTPSGKCSIIFWVLILLSGAFGCGWDDPIAIEDLPNDYTMTMWSWGQVYIEDPKGTVVTDSGKSVYKYGILDEFVYGTYISSSELDIDSTQSIRGYFITDTLLDSHWSTPERELWEQQLHELDITHPELEVMDDHSWRLPSRNDMWWALAALVAVWASSCLAYWFYCARKNRTIECSL